MTNIEIYSKKQQQKKSKHIWSQMKSIQINVKQVKTDKPKKEKKKEHKRNETKNSTILFFLLDFYCSIFAFGLRFLF
jgi:hypothetical protein